MTRIVFASCMNSNAFTPLLGRRQPVWKYAAVQKPEWLILCGDNIYMDYVGTMYDPMEWSPKKFATEMYERYAQQFAVKSFQKLVKSIPSGQVLGVWDDHDFAWNNCNGADPGSDMPIKKKIAAAMHHHYFAALNQRPLPSALPKLPMPDLANPPDGDRDIYRATNIGQLRVLLCDGRRYREDVKGNKKASLLGDAQETWLFGELAASDGPFMLVSGSTMTNGEDQSWDAHQKFFNDRFLPAVGGKTVIFVGGDVHENRLLPQVPDRPVEVVSSAAVLDPPFYKHAFGVIELKAGQANVFLYRRGSVQYTGKLNLATGVFKTSMSALLKIPDPKPSVQDARSQRRTALGRLVAGK